MRARIATLLRPIAMVAALPLGGSLTLAEAVELTPGDVVAVQDGPGPDLGSLGEVVHVDAASGATRVITRGDGAFHDLQDVAVESSGSIIVLDVNDDHDIRLLRVDPGTGAQAVLAEGGILAAVDPQSQSRAIAIEASGSIAVRVQGGILRVDATSGSQSFLSQDADLAGPSPVLAASGGDLLTTGFFDDLVRVNTSTGAVTSLGAVPYVTGIAPAPDGSVFLVTPAFSGAQVLRRPPGGGALELVTEDDRLVDPVDLARAPDGSLLVADQGANAVIRVDPETGAQSLATLPGALHDVTGVAAEADGSVLVTDEDLRALLRAHATTGAVVPVSTGRVLNQPRGAAIGPDGWIYFAERQSAKILRVDPASGALELVARDGSLGEPTALAIDPEGHLLVANAADEIRGVRGHVVRIDPATGVQEIVSSAPTTEPLGGIAVSSDPESDAAFTTLTETVSVIHEDVLRVDLASGERTPLLVAPPSSTRPFGLAGLHAVASATFGAGLVPRGFGQPPVDQLIVAAQYEAALFSIAENGSGSELVQGGPLERPTDVAADPAVPDALLAVDRGTGSPGAGKVLAVYVGDAGVGYAERFASGLDRPWALDVVPIAERFAALGRVFGDAERPEDDVEGLLDPLRAFASADGRHLYVLSGQGLAVFARQPDATLQLGSERVESGYADFVASDATAWASLPPAGVARFLRDAESGALTDAGMLSAPAGSDGFGSAVALTASGDVLFVGGSQRVWAYDANSLVLRDDAGVASGSDPIEHLAVLPGDRFVYAAAPNGSSIAVLEWDAGAGTLTPVDGFGTVFGGRTFEEVRGLAVSPDGAHLYAGFYLDAAAEADADGALGVFSIDPATGAPTPLQTILPLAPVTQGLDDPNDLVVTADGSHVLATGERFRVSALSRDAPTGLLTPQQVVDLTDVFVRGGGSPFGSEPILAAAPQGSVVYVGEGRFDSVLVLVPEPGIALAQLAALAALALGIRPTRRRPRRP